MLKVLLPDEPATQAFLAERLASRGSSDVRDAAKSILCAVRDGGDAALLELTARFDGVALTSEELRLCEDDMTSAVVAPKTCAALERAAQRIEAFHRNEVRNDWWTVSPDGVLLGQRFVPLDSVGIYVPGGAAPYASSLLMAAVPARAAGVRRIVIASPPGPDGTIHPVILAAARLCGVTEIYRVGGAQAIGALAYGTKTIPRVAKIVGPGNAYVTEAKRLVYGDVGIDSLAGPSEVAILADASANPRYVAADLLAQAEHDRDAVVALVTPQRGLADAVNRELETQLVGLSRRETISAALERGIACVVSDLDAAVAWVERFAPEHLELMVSDPAAVAPRIHCAGVILCGPYAPAALCDYGVGPNHVLPTGSASRFASALGIDDFVRRISIVCPGRDALLDVSRDAVVLAQAEQLDAHAGALRVRQEER